MPGIIKNQKAKSKQMTQVSRYCLFLYILISPPVCRLVLNIFTHVYSTVHNLQVKYIKMKQRCQICLFHKLLRFTRTYDQEHVSYDNKHVTYDI